MEFKDVNGTPIHITLSEEILDGRLGLFYLPAEGAPRFIALAELIDENFEAVADENDRLTPEAQSEVELIARLLEAEAARIRRVWGHRG